MQCERIGIAYLLARTPTTWKATSILILCSLGWNDKRDSSASIENDRKLKYNRKTEARSETNFVEKQHIKSVQRCENSE